ncbi:protein kinase [Trypanosoma rangeli SC58]|uniref:Protein kinase n=1 Tax=Trypanosoma rangeli SC58 TaxID=429131 RepID=A0A061J1F5_TRYRA|nr:protein kinase [Trypanosoma rangeli SC58]
MDNSEGRLPYRLYVGLTCAAIGRLSTDYPVVPLAFGVSVLAGALAVYVSAGSPRWKGAPTFFSHGRTREQSSCSKKKPHPVALAAVYTSTRTPWFTSRKEEVDVLLETVAEVDEALHGDEDQLSLVSPSRRDCQQTHHLPLHSASLTLPSSPRQCKHSAHCQHSCNTADEFCEATAPMQAPAVSGDSAEAVDTHPFYRTLSMCASNSSSADTPTAHFSSGASHATDAVPSDATGNSHLGKVDWNSAASLTLHGTFEAGRGGTVAETSNSAVTPSIGCVPGCASNTFLGCTERCKAGRSGYDWKRKFGETEVSGGKLQQTLSHLVGATAVARLQHANSSRAINLADGAQRQYLSGSVSVSLDGRTASTATDAPTVADSRVLEVEDEGAGEFVSAQNFFCASSEYAEGHDEECVITEALGSLARPVQLEAQLRSLETRLEQQMRGSVGRYEAKTSATCHDVGAAADLPAAGSYHDGEPEARRSTPDGTDAFSPLRGDTSSLLHQQRTQVFTDAVDRPPATTSHENDRRVDDVFVRPHGNGAASYSLSLTYHDAHGTLRTIDTHTLPPLKFPSRSAAATPSSTILTGSVASSRLTPLSLQDVRLDTSRRPPVSTGHRNSKVNVGRLVAPLPPLELAAGPHLQGVAGRRGEFRIGAFLGGGCCGKVYECLNTETGEVLAAKQLVFDAKEPKLQFKLKQLEVELEVLTLATRHGMPWIVGFHGAEKRGHSVLMYLEYCSRGSLLDYMLSSRAPSPLATPLAMSMASSPSLKGAAEQMDTPSSAAKTASHDEEQGRKKTNWGTSDGGSLLSSLPTQVSLNTAAASSPKKPAQPEILPLPIEEVQRFARQTVEALHFLHFHGYAHWDVKTGNILVTEERDARLADFGCSTRLRRSVANSEPCEPAGHKEGMLHESSKGYTGVAAGVAFREILEEAAAPPYPVVDDGTITGLRGTAVYMAPEMIRFERCRLGTAGDVWSLGCVVMELATGAAPWRHLAKDKLRVLFRVGSSREDLPLPPNVIQAAEKARCWLAHEDERLAVTGLGPCPTEEVELLKRRRLEIRKSRDEAEVDADAAHAHLAEVPGYAEHHRRMRLFVALESFLSLCLHIRPEDRPRCEELLLHPFLTIS